MYLCIYDIMSILIQVPFIGTLAKVRKAAIIFIFSVYQFVSPQWNSSTPYLLTPWSRVLFEKLTVSAASQEIPRIIGTRKFITLFTSARHLFLS